MAILFLLDTRPIWLSPQIHPSSESSVGSRDSEKPIGLGAKRELRRTAFRKICSPRASPPPSAIPPGSPAIREFFHASPFPSFVGRRPSLGLFARLEFERHRGLLPGNDHAHPRIPEGSKTVACSGALPGSSAGSLGPKTQEVQGLLTPGSLI